MAETKDQSGQAGTSAPETCQGCVHWRGKTYVDAQGQVQRSCVLFKMLSNNGCELFQGEGDA